jgi:hypothetical protein
MVLLEYADEKVKKSLEKLKKKDPEFYEHIKNALRNIQEDPTCGIKIPIKLIPKDWKKKYGINNLYKYNLPNAWRLMYSLAGNRVELIAIVLGCFNHKEYERIFKY